MSKLREVAAVFTKLGFLGFGGPPVHIRMMEDEVVHNRKWMSHEHFLDLIGATNLLPGPNSTQMALHCGRERAGWKGLLVAGACFILPAVLITGTIAWLYQRYGTSPQAVPYTCGIKPALIGIIISLVILLGKKSVKSFELGLLGICVVLLAFFGVNQALLLFASGAAGMLIYTFKKQSPQLHTFFIPLLAVLNSAAYTPKYDNWKIFRIFLKIGSVLYGGGYVLFSFMHTALVKPGLLSEQVITDAIAVGQFTPGPVFSAATFIGWQMNGAAGAACATAGIFVPSFLFIGLLNPLVYRLRSSKVLSAFLDAVNVAAVALIFEVAVELGKTVLKDWRTMLITILAFTISFVFRKINAAIIIAGGAALGYLFSIL